ncbi:MAG TPA: hypothetical protein VHV27_13235 [Phenylobacterium sp.]|nr:hypothetical protein [Phenylobacterium sp.]
MQLSSMAIAALLGVAIIAPPAFAAETALLSITGIPLDQTHHLTKVEVRTWGVEVLAVCHVPKVSVVSVDFDLDPGGVLTWKANSWHGELDRSQLNVLSSLFLVRLSGYQREPRGDPRREYHPATFEGVATIATIDEPTHERKLKLHSNNFGLNPAQRCPDPR